MNANSVIDHYSCECNACEFHVRKLNEARPIQPKLPKPVPLIQDKDFNLLLRKLQAPNKLTRSVRVRIPDTAVFLEGEFKFIAYYDEVDGYIKFTPKMTLQQMRNFLLERRTSDTILIKFYDNNVQISSMNELLHLIMRRKIDPIWDQLLYIQNFDQSKSFDLYNFDFKYDIESKYEEFERAKVEILILNGEIPRASSDFVPLPQEEAYENALSEPQYCRYVAYKIVHYLDIFGSIKVVECRFCFHKKKLMGVERMETLATHRESFFDSEVLLKRKRIENDDDFFCQRIIETNVYKERQHALDVYKKILQFDNDRSSESYVLRNKLAVIGFDPIKHQEQLQRKFQNVVMSSKDPVATIKTLVIEQKMAEDKVQSLLKNEKKQKH